MQVFSLFCSLFSFFPFPRKFLISYCPNHIVWKSSKMSHFLILAFSSKYCAFKVDLSGNTVWPQTRQIDHFRHFQINLKNINGARFARNVVKWDFFCDFQTPYWMTNPFLLTFKESLERVFPTPFFSPPLYEKTWDEISSYILVICFLTIFSPSSSRRKKGRVGRNGTLGAHTLRLSLFFCRVVYSSKIMNAVEKL